MSPNEQRAAPVVVLCSHRSGSSLLMSLLADAGLHLGELLPAAPDNPRGFFENREVVELNRQLLNRRDRDWTCPPAHLDHREVELGPYRRLGAHLGDEGTPWGFKDPRTLFTLPVWAAALGPVRLLGLHRNATDVARSIAARMPVSLDHATAIALAYEQRLAEAHKALRFPVLSFDAGPAEFIAKVADVCRVLELNEPDPDAAARYDPQLVHHRESSDVATEYGEYLTKAAEDQYSLTEPRTPHTIVRTWERLPSSLTETLRADLGPRYVERQEQLAAAALTLLPAVGEMVVVGPDEKGVRVSNMSVPTITRQQLVGDDRRRPSHLIAPLWFDDVRPPDLDTMWTELASVLDTPGVCALGGWFIEGDELPATRLMQPAGVLARRDGPPHLHHLDRVISSLLGHSLYAAQVERQASGRTNLFVTTERSLQNAELSAPGLRTRLADTEHRIATLEAEIEREQRHLDERVGQLQTEVEDATADANLEIEQLAVAAEEEHRRAEAAAARARHAQLAYDRLANRRIVRMALGAARPVRPLFKAIRAARTGRPLPKPTLNLRGRVEQLTWRPERARAALVAALQSLDTSTLAAGPSVSIVVLTRDGAHHLRRLLPQLDATRYRSFEVIVVDNGSTDETAELLGRSWSFPLSVIRHDHNTSFSAGNNEGVAAAAGELVLFLNNDVEPITPGWLGAMVSALTEQPERVAAGAVLIYPEDRDRDQAFTVQHRGIQLEMHDGAPYARNIAADDPLDPLVARTADVAAVSAAAMLVRRQAFETVGGFDTGYVYGTEDVDLSLKLGRLGSLVVVGASPLFHYESSTQNAQRRELLRINRLGNWLRFAEQWAPTFERTVRAERLRVDSVSAEHAPPTVAITVTSDDPSHGYGDYYTAHELGEAFESHGWTVRYIERAGDRWYDVDGQVDLVISLLDAYDVRRAPPGALVVAWVRNWIDRWIAQPWFDTFDLVVASSQSAADAIAEGSGRHPVVVPLATNPDRFSPGQTVPTFDADYAFTGNYWGVGRDLVSLLEVRPGEQFRVFGTGWESEGRVARYWRGHLDYSLLPDLYRSVKIVLDDTAVHALPHGCVNSRVFDALAAGALVLSNNVAGSKELFDGELPTYTNREELRSQLDVYLNDDDLRSKTVENLRTRVLERYTYDRLPGRFLEALRSEIDRPRIAFKVGVPNEELVDLWGDSHFAAGVAAALAKLGYGTETHILPEWDRADRQGCDVVIHLRGLTTYAPKPAHVNVLWVLSHPDDLAPAECDKYDLVVVASRPFAEELAARSSTPVVFLPQATDQRRFKPLEPDDALTEELLFVGSSRQQRRHGVDWAIERDLPLSIYGREWDGLVPSRLVKGEYIANEQLPLHYASAKVVLNDHWPDMRDHGFVSNRIFDVLAVGGVVVTDPVAGLDELFGDLVPTYDSPAELDTVVRDLLDDPDRRRAIAERGASLVAAEHTFEHRARQLDDLLAPLLADRAKNLEGETFGDGGG